MGARRLDSADRRQGGRGAQNSDAQKGEVPGHSCEGSPQFQSQEAILDQMAA